jgi:hypothetical protein
MICKQCAVDLDISLFPKNKNCKSGYEGTCKKCSYANQQVWKAQNLDRYKESKNRWYLKNFDLICSKAQQFAKDHPEWKADHCAKRRRRNRVATPTWDIDLTEFVYEEARALCKDRKVCTGIDWHIDHIVPLHGKHVSGLHVWNNFAVIPAKVNIAKGNRYESGVNIPNY